MGAGTRVLHGAVLTAEGGPVEVGATCVVMENAKMGEAWGMSENDAKIDPIWDQFAG